MNVEHIDIYQSVTNRIITALEAGTPPWVRPWTGESDPNPINADSQRAYRGINWVTLQIEAQLGGYNRNVWMTYRQAAARGAQVRNGARGCPVVFWKLRKINAAAETEPWPCTDDIERRIIPLIRYSTVFNVAQIDGLPPEYSASPETVPTWTSKEAAETIINKSGADIQHGGFRAFYQPTQDFVQLPSPNAFADAGSYYATALHELCHWSGHPTRLNRQLGSRFGAQAYAMEELIAEMGSAFLCAHSRINGLLQHASYVQNWLQVLRSDKRAIFVASTKAQNAADYLLDRASGKPAVGVAASAMPSLRREAEAA